MTALPHILNWRRINDRLTTSGQPSKAQLAEIAALGIEHIVNLGPYDNKGALDDEPGCVATLGMGYTYIPVDFDAPSDRDFQAFCDAIEALPDAKIHVHCIYNARVSAFFYRYAKEKGGYPEADAYANMDSIWRPGDNWAGFLSHPEAAGKPNRYAGDDY